MPRDGQGNFVRGNGIFTGPTTWASQASSADKVIDPNRHDVHDEDIAAALSGSVARDGQAAMTGNLPMGNNRITGLATGVNDTDAATKTQAVDVTPSNRMVKRSHVVQAGLYPYANVFDPEWAVPASPTDCTVELQACLDANAGGVVLIPDDLTFSSVTVPADTIVITPAMMPGLGGTGPVRLFMTGTPAKMVRLIGSGAGFAGFVMVGTGAELTPTDAITVEANNCRVEKIDMSDFSGAALVAEAGTADGQFGDIYTENMMLTRAIAARKGCVDLDGTAHRLWRFDTDLNLPAQDSINNFMVGVHVQGVRMSVEDCYVQKADVGLYVAGSGRHTIESFRSRVNWAHGFVNESARNQFGNIRSIDNAQQADDTFYDFHNLSGAGVCLVDGFHTSSTRANRVKYGFFEENTGDPAVVTGFRSEGHRTAASNQASQFAKTGFIDKVFDLRPKISLNGLAKGEFTDFLSDAQCVIMMFDRVSTAVTSLIPRIELQDSTGWVQTGYLGSSGELEGSPTPALMTDGFRLSDSWAAGRVLSGFVVLHLLDATNNIWVAGGTPGRSDFGGVFMTGGRVSLTGKCTGARLIVDDVILFDGNSAVACKIM